MNISTVIPELETLKAVNQKLASLSHASRKDLLDMDIIRESDELVYRVSSDQRLPFKKLYLPVAFTGILEPQKQVNENHQAIQIILPGAGTTFSHAATLGDIAGTFHGRKSRNRGQGRKSSQSFLAALLPEAEKEFRVASFPTDLPLNGMGSDAPFELASDQGCMAMIRHVHLVLSLMYPERPVFVAGRSTGGMMSILYAQHYSDVTGAIAVNPPHPDPALVGYTINYMEANADVLSELLDSPSVSLHERSWQAFKQFVPVSKYPNLPSLAPTLTFVSTNDPLNFSPEYIPALKTFAEESENRTTHVINSNQNNLWNRKAEATYREVIELHLQFILNQIRSGDRAEILV